jgi:ATP-dependent RNA helicase DDX49/DBP8
LLDPGFEAELQAIMHNLPTANRQTMMFSATITKSISALQDLILGKALLFEAPQDNQVVSRCTQE